MTKTRLTVFLCTGEDCARRWAHVCDGSPGKWLKRQVKDAGLPYKLEVVKTCCMDRCEDAACLCCVCGPAGGFETRIRRPEDADRVLAGLRSCAEQAADPFGFYGRRRR